MSLALATLSLAAAPLVFETCRIGADDGVTMAAECASLAVPENRAAPDAREITLALARIKSFRSSSNPPLVFIAGGPGQSALESFPQISGAFGEVRKSRDILLIDQRGTGQSNPLQCVSLQDTEEMTLEFDAELAREEAARCAQFLDADLRFYTTLDAVKDLEAVRSALGAEQLALYGISYGTRVAQEYLRRHPERVEKVILDGVVVPGEALGPRIATDAQAALNRMFERCAADEACASRFPRLRERVDALRERLERDPVEVDIRDPFTFAPRRVTINWLRAAALLRMYSYLPESVALLPLLLHHAETNDWQSFAGSMLALERQNEDLLYIGMHNSVVCSEDAPFFGAGLSEEPAYLGTVMTEFIGAMCEVWPRRELPNEMHVPVVSDVPALVLSGEADPVTPPRNGAAVATLLSNSVHLVAPGQGHGVAWRGCAPRLIATFLVEGLEDLDASCLQALKPYPFFIDPNGPTP